MVADGALMVAPCVIVAETVRLDVGRGVAVVDHDVTLASIGGSIGGSSGGAQRCGVDFGAVLLAREEGRGPPDRVAFRIDVDGVLTVVGGPFGSASIEVDVGADAPRVVRVRAAMRGERFVAAAVGIDPSVRRGPIDFVARAKSTWGIGPIEMGAVAGVARWVDVGVPVVVQIDLDRDHEPLFLSTRIVESQSPTFVVDAGPMLGASPAPMASMDRARELSAGGARTLSALLEDLPIAVATAADDATAIARLRETAHLALSASLSTDPLTAAVGQRLATAIANGFVDCRRDDRSTVPKGWPAPMPRFVATGLLDDADAGCPRIADLVVSNHPKLPVEREGAAALEEAVADAKVEPLARVGSVDRPIFRPFRRFRRARGRTLLVWVIGGLVALLLGAAMRYSRFVAALGGARRSRSCRYRPACAPGSHPKP